MNVVMIKKFLLISTLTFLLLSSFSVTVSAQPFGDSSQKRADIQQMIEEKKAENEQKRLGIQNRIEEKKASHSARLTALRQERLRFFYSQMSRRIDALIDRLDILIIRIESRIAKLNEEGADTSEVEAEVESAKVILSDTLELKEEADVMFEEIISSEDPKEAFSQLRNLVGNIKLNLIDVHRILVKTIGNIKGLRVGNTPQEGCDEIPTVTPSPTPVPEVTGEE